MSDLLVLVKESISCSVIIENLNFTLEAFRHDTLEEQISDALPWQYKFTRLFKNKGITIGVNHVSHSIEVTKSLHTDSLMPCTDLLAGEVVQKLLEAPMGQICLLEKRKFETPLILGIIKRSRYIYSKRKSNGN